MVDLIAEGLALVGSVFVLLAGVAMAVLTTAEPITTPSASWQTSRAWSGEPMPTPTSTGLSVRLRNLRAITREVEASSERSPVTPSNPTAYTNPRARSTTACSLSSEPVGAASMTVSTPAASAAEHHGADSSRGTSGRIAAATPESARVSAKRCQPKRNTRFA